ncbi:MAG TPA: response regulator transcription factor [Steroidobacteraceae bacterium]|mgnify:CR=1 FL=1|nr:response regulator transcription factor [Steroidobacteraceae bacterium]
MIRVVLVDDHTLVREGLHALLTEFPGVQVVAQARDGASGLEAVREHAPDLLLTDLSMAGMNGIELTERATREQPGLRVIVLSMYSDRQHVMRVLAAGASAYLLKDSARSELAEAIAAVVRGGKFLSPAAAKQLSDPAAGQGEADPLALLTERQREVLRLIAEGVPTKQIAYRLDISPKTVEAHRATIMARLKVRQVAGLVRIAVRSGLIAPEP